MISLSNQDVTRFHEDGFVVVERVLDEATIEAGRQRFPKLFRGEFETGLRPDEWNWREGRDAEDLTRQICNGWKSDRVIASIVLRSDVGRVCAELRDWPGARINQDNVLWKSPKSRSLGFHQDDSYQQWITPNQMMTCWFTLDDTRADRGTIEYVRGSHLWPAAPPIANFHAPDDPLLELNRAATAIGREPEIIAIEVPAGSLVVHHGRTWHGSRDNTGHGQRRSVVAHCMSSAAKFNPDIISPIYGRYKRVGVDEMDESFFPILWRSDGYRTNWLDRFMAG